MSGTGGHPSAYALDRAVALGRLGDVQDHLAACEACAAHLRAVQERRAMPERVAALTAAPPVSAPPRWAWMAGLGAAAAVLAAVVFARAPQPQDAYVGVKGGPVAALYVKRGDEVFPWSPQERVRPGDLLRLAVVPDGFSHLTVATPDAKGWHVLYEGDIPPEREFDLPASWRVDAQGRGEELLVVLTRQSLHPEALKELAVQRPRTDNVWTALLEIEKIGGR